MPSPIAHTAVALALVRLQRVRNISEPETAVNGLVANIAVRLNINHSLPQDPATIATILLFSILPDFDFVPGLFIGQFDKFHNTISHNLFAGVVVALFAGSLAALRRRRVFWYWFGLALICYEIHVIMDYFTVGRGVMLFWPISSDRFSPSFHLFYGLHRSDGWLSIQHMWTFLSESAFSILTLFLAYRVQPVNEANSIGKGL